MYESMKNCNIEHENLSNIITPVQCCLTKKQFVRMTFYEIVDVNFLSIFKLFMVDVTLSCKIYQRPLSSLMKLNKWIFKFAKVSPPSLPPPPSLSAFYSVESKPYAYSSESLLGFCLHKMAGKMLTISYIFSSQFLVQRHNEQGIHK